MKELVRYFNRVVNQCTEFVVDLPPSGWGIIALCVVVFGYMLLRGGFLARP